MRSYLREHLIAIQYPCTRLGRHVRRLGDTIHRATLTVFEKYSDCPSIPQHFHPNTILSIPAIDTPNPSSNESVHSQEALTYANCKHGNLKKRIRIRLP
jgi:hypothetical protein